MEKRCIFWFINKKHFDSLPTGLIELVKTVDVVFCFESFKKDETYSRGKTELSEVNLYNIILDYLIYHEFI